MRFYDYADNLAILKRHHLDRTLGIKTRDDMYRAVISENDPMGIRHMVFDKAWHDLGKPYYDVYPCVIPMLTKLNLDFPGTTITPPNGIQHLLLRLPYERHDLAYEDLTVRCVFLSFQSVSRDVGSRIRETGLTVGFDIGETVGGTYMEMPVYTMRIFPLDERTIETTLNALDTHNSTFLGIKVPDKLILDVVRLALTVCLIGDNPEFLEQQVLSKDEGKFSVANEQDKQRLFDKAKRRGKWGFSLGKSIEVIPHIRRPHPCIVWTGHGRTVPKIVLRKGSFIHKSKVEQLPTGYDLTDDNGQQQSDGETNPPSEN